jgi:hypothetical protein
MVDMKLHGGMVDMIVSLTHQDLPPNPVTGAALAGISQALLTWLMGPTYLADCHLSGLSADSTRRTIADIAGCVQRGEAARF